MHIGLIGGIGPAATVVYYERLVRRFREAGRMLELTIVQADVDTLARNALADQRDAQVQIYVDLIGRLKRAGADIAAITSIGGHFCYEELAPVSPLPLASALAPMDTYFQAHGISTIGVLGTRAVMATRLYGQLSRTAAVVPDGDLAEIGQDYIDMALEGVCSEDRRERFFERGRQMMTGQGADAILMGGTDLGLAFDGHDPGYPVVDAVDIHVEALFRLATEDTASTAALLSRPL